MTKNHTSAIVILDDPMLVANFKALADLAIKHRFPAIGFTGFADAGGLMSFGPSLPILYRRVVPLVEKILKGTRVGDIPVERPTTFELVVNMKTAKALGIKIPTSILVRADKVIE